MTQDLQTGYAGLFTGRTISELMDLVIERLGESDFTRYSETRVLNALNRKSREFATKTRILSGWSIIPMRAGVPGYALPKMCLPDGLERARFYSTTTSYDDLRLRDREYMDDHFPGWKAAADGTPQILVVGDWFGNVMKMEVYPPPLTAGTTYVSGTDLGVAVGGSDLPSVSNDITGSASGGSTTTLVDTSVDFTTMGLVAGMAVVKTNGTAGSEPVGYISVIAATQLTFAAIMTNSGAFASGDSYQIMTGQYGTITSMTDEEDYFFSADVGVIAQLTVPANNILIEFKRYPLLFDMIAKATQKPEIPWAWHEQLSDGAAGDILSDDTARKSTADQKRAAELKASFAGGLIEALSKPSMPTNRPPRIIPRIKR